MEKFTRWIIQHAGWVVILSLLIAAVSTFFTIFLYQNLRTDMEELLPKTARSVSDLEKVVGRFESTTNLGILIFSDDPVQSKRFVQDFAQAIEDERSPLVSRVEYKIDEELRFFSRRRALFIDLPDLVRIRDYVRDRIQFEQEIRNPLQIFSGIHLREPHLDFFSLQGKYAGRVKSFTQFKDGYYATRDQKVRVILVYLAGKSSGIGNALKLRALVDTAVARLGPQNYAPDLRVRYTGDVQNLVEEHASLLNDLGVSAVIVFILVTAVMLFFFRDVLATSMLVLSLIVGTLFSFGVAYFAVGYLNANSAFLGSIVLGNGVNFGIIVLARYFEERRKGAGLEESIVASTSRTQKATMTAALAAGFSYGSLMLTGFRGFQQFGIIGLIGMVLCWCSAFSTLPALLFLLGRWRARRGQVIEPHAEKKHFFSFSGFVSAFVFKFPRSILIASLICCVVSGIAVHQYSGDILETDMSRLRDSKSMTEGSGHLSQYLDQIFERYVSPVVILAPSIEGAGVIEQRLRQYQKEDGPQAIITGVYTLGDFVPKEQSQKIAVLREIRLLLGARLIRQLNSKDQALAKDLLRPEAFRPFGVQDLPSQIRDRFKENDGSLGKLIMVEPILDPERMRDASQQAKFIRQLRSAADLVSPHAPVVGQLPITVDMYQSVRRDGPRATAFALGSVIVLVVALFRELRIVCLVLGALTVGVGWLVGYIFGTGLKINFLNFIALPITFGIGVDYAINIVQRYRLEGVGSILRVIQSTGSAVALASLTTIIGYGSLLIAGNRGFVSFGRIAIVGECTCLIAALLAMPAYLRWRDVERKGADAVSREEERSARKVA